MKAVKPPTFVWTAGMLATVVAWCGCVVSNCVDNRPEQGDRAVAVEFIDLSRPNRRLADLMTESVAGTSVRWVNEMVIVEDEHELSPASPLRDTVAPDDAAWTSGFVSGVEVFATVPYDSFYRIGGNSDGHAFLLSTANGRYYQWFHDPDAISEVAQDLPTFQNWLSTQSPEFVPGCGFAVLLSSWMDHRLPYQKRGWLGIDSRKLAAALCRSHPFDDQFIAPEAFHLVDRTVGISVRFHQELRGQQDQCLVRCRLDPAAVTAVVHLDKILRSHGLDAGDVQEELAPEKTFDDFPLLRSFLQARQGSEFSKRNVFWHNREFSWQCRIHHGRISISPIARGNARSVLVTGDETEAVDFLRKSLGDDP